jgi:hypothetical protein
MPDLNEQIARGEFKTLKAWLNSNIHETGSVHPSADEVTRGGREGGRAGRMSARAKVDVMSAQAKQPHMCCCPARTFLACIPQPRFDAFLCIETMPRKTC